MKTKILSGIFTLLMLTSLGCKRGGIGPGGITVKCENRLEDYSTAISAFIQTPTSGTCNSLRTSLNDLVKKCSTALGGVNTVTYEELDCSQF